MRFQNKAALVTGAGGGIGEGYAEASRKAFGGVDYDGIRGMILRQLVPKRMGEVDDIVKACLFLLSDEASWITAQIMAVDGGQVMRV